jgi:hypothetical protein
LLAKFVLSPMRRRMLARVVATESDQAPEQTA